MSLYRGMPKTAATALLGGGLILGVFQCGQSGAPDSSQGSSGGATYTPMEAGAGPAPGMPGDCTYTDDITFCACLGMHDGEAGGQPYNCGGIDANDEKGINRPAYCGACPAGQYCKADNIGDNFGRCTPGNPVQYPYQRQKMNMLVALGESDKPVFDYGSAVNINDGRGYTITTVGFTTGTGDFIFVAACYNDAEPNNVLQKYWGTRDSSGRALNGLIYYNDLFNQSGNNQGDTSFIDKLGTCTPKQGLTCFQEDVETASTDPKFIACVDGLVDAFYLAPAAQHAQQRGLTGALTVGYLFDTEVNFGEDADPSSTVLGAKGIIAKADADYGSNVPMDFTGKPWEESRWLGLLIKERTLEMSKDPTWLQDMDQNATWEAARRQHTAASNTPESGTDLSMDYDFVSQYKAASTSVGASATMQGCAGSAAITPCWGHPPLASDWDTCSSIYTVRTDKSAGATDAGETDAGATDAGVTDAGASDAGATDAGATDPTTWTAAWTANNPPYASCPSNPTP